MQQMLFGVWGRQEKYDLQATELFKFNCKAENECTLSRLSTNSNPMKIRKSLKKLQQRRAILTSPKKIIFNSTSICNLNFFKDFSHFTSVSGQESEGQNSLKANSCKIHLPLKLLDSVVFAHYILTNKCMSILHITLHNMWLIYFWNKIAGTVSLRIDIVQRTEWLELQYWSFCGHMKMKTHR